MLNANLYDVLKLSEFNGLKMEAIRKITIQVLHALVHLQQEKIIHCDLKPENILLKQEDKCGVKIIDFGSSCFEGKTIYTYIQSRFY